MKHHDFGSVLIIFYFGFFCLFYSSFQQQIYTHTQATTFKFLRIVFSGIIIIVAITIILLLVVFLLCFSDFSVVFRIIISDLSLSLYYLELYISNLH